MSKEISYQNAMIGLSIVGGYANHIVGILQDGFKFEICIGLFHKVHERLPVSEQEMYADEQTVNGYENLKNVLRAQFQNAFNSLAHADETLQSEREEKWQKHQHSLKVREGLKQMHKPAPEGTVDELAKKYGVSKSYIRNLKRENRLHELTETEPQF